MIGVTPNRPVAGLHSRVKALRWPWLTGFGATRNGRVGRDAVGPVILVGTRHDHLVRCLWWQDLAHANDIVSEPAEELDRTGRDMHVGQQPHAMAEVFSLASQAPYLAAW